MIIFEDATKKKVQSKGYNYKFDKKTGFFARWGKTKEDDPLSSPFGPEIADIEVNAENGPETMDDVDACASSIRIEELGYFDFEAMESILEPSTPLISFLVLVSLYAPKPI